LANSDSVVTEADEVMMMPNQVYDGEQPMERSDPRSSVPRSEVTASNTHDNHGHDECDEDMQVEKPRIIRWFRFSVIDTGIG